MKLGPKSLIAIALGIALGGVIRYLTPDESDQAPADEARFASQSDAPQKNSRANHSLRPTFAEVCQSPLKPELLAHFLEEATMGEVTKLMDAVFHGNAELEAWMWMLQLRGLEIDSQAVFAWTMSQETNISHMDSLIKQWTMMDPYAALHACMKEGPQIRNLAMEHMVETDPDRAVAAIEALRPGATALKELRALKRAKHFAADPKAGLKEALTLEDPDEREQSVAAILQVWAQSNASDALQWIEDQGSFDGAATLMEVVIKELAETNPTLARLKLEELPPSRSRSMLEGDIVTQWAQSDPNGALGWLKKMPMGSRRDYLFGSMVKYLDREPEQLFNLIRDLKINVHRSYLFNEFDLKNASSHYGGRHPELAEAIESATIGLAEKSPAKALEALKSLGTDPTPRRISGGVQIADSFVSDFVRQVAKNWVAEDAEAAAHWAASLPENDFAQRIQRSIFGNWADAEPQSVADYLDAKGSESQGHLFNMLANSWASEEPEAALFWVNELDGDIKGEALLAALRAVSASDPPRALQYVNGIQDPEEQQRILERATREWRRDDPAEVMEWLAIQPLAAGVDNLVIETSEIWAKSHPMQASLWIDSMRSGPRKDQAAAGLIDALVSDTRDPDIEAADRWLNVINDPIIRQEWSDKIDKER